MTGFQQSTNAVPAPGIAGDFASTNPRHYCVAGPGGFVADPVNGLTCGRFAWADPSTGTILSNTGQGAPLGFVANTHEALITTYLGQVSYVIPPGFGVIDIFDGADFWVKNDGTTTAVPGQKVYASNATGQVVALAATATPPTGGTGTSSSVAAGAFSGTGSIAISSTINPSPLGPGTAPAVLTISVYASGALVPGALLTGSGVTTGTRIVAQLSGTTGQVGTYSVSIAQTVASTAITGAYGTMTIGGTVTGSFAVNDTITGSGVDAGTYITALGTGTGGAGTYIVSSATVVGTTSISAYSATETPWVVANGSFGAPGERIKISRIAA